MPKVITNPLYRILDANFNRTKEGLRVCEDISRYAWDNTSLTKAYKTLRHELTDVLKGMGPAKILEERHIQGDVGRATTSAELKRSNLDDVFWANNQRVKESLRVLEEVMKLSSPQTAQAFKKTAV